MIKRIEIWSVEKLSKEFVRIAFPEYQREPNLWSRAEKQRLVDSMVRQFDMASLYFYEHDNESIDCVDGRQRIGAIMSFLGLNPNDNDNGFTFKVRNEIWPEADPLFESLQDSTFEAIKHKASKVDTAASQFERLFLGYELTIVRLSESQEPQEFNLQFTRLNLGVIINSGEKLNAMIGDLRDKCFADDGLGTHRFLQNTRIPTRRFSREQVAAQILAQIFSINETKEYARTRHFDLQRLFKQHSNLAGEHKMLIDKTTALLDLLANALPDMTILRNRAITISAVLLAWESQVKTREDASILAEFIREFLCRLNWQLKKGLDVDSEYRYLIDFQRHITQASVEKPAVKARAATLKNEYDRWRESGHLQGDAEWTERNQGRSPSDTCVCR